MKQQQESAKVFSALGVVFGDIGTSPLYALPAAFWLGHFAVTTENVLGIVSMILWALTIIVAIKYIGLMMQVSNDGEGGIMALVALLRHTIGKQRAHVARNWAIVGLVGVALFYGDSMITPAISVLSAVEGTQLSFPELTEWTVPIALGVLTILFLLQSRGTARLGRWFGPIMVVWFVVSGLTGAIAIRHHPEVLVALSPLEAVNFIVAHPAAAFIALGAVVLAITGAEALYADMGHFGRMSIVRGWFGIVYPALILNYLGQGAVLIGDTRAATHTYFHLFPGWAQFDAVILATMATLIASQSVISGAFSLTRQAMQLGYLPRLRIVHTAQESGQIYIAGLNWSLYIAVAVLVVIFGSSARLSDAYGMAESGTLLASTTLLLFMARYVWKRSWPLVYAFGIVLVSIEVGFVAACSTKLVHGAWIPLAIAGIVLVILTTWARGSGLVGAERRKREGKLNDFVTALPTMKGVSRLPGTAIYLAHHPGYTPLALKTTVDQLHELSERVVIVTVAVANLPHIEPSKRATINELGSHRDGIVEVALSFGFDDVPNVPAALERLHDMSSELHLNLEQATYFISETDIVLRVHSQLSRLRGLLFTGLHRVSAPSPVYFRLPPERTVDMATYIEI